MGKGQLYVFAHELAFQLRKLSLWMFFLAAGCSLGQIHLADSTVFVQNDEVFVVGEIYQARPTVVFIAKNTTISNFPEENGFVIIDQNKVQKTEKKEKLQTSKTEKKPQKEAIKTVQPEVKSERFVRAAKKSDRRLRNSNHYQSLAIVSNISSNIIGHFTFSSETLLFFEANQNEKIIQKCDLNKSTQIIFSLFARPPPDFT